MPKPSVALLMLITGSMLPLLSAAATPGARAHLTGSTLPDLPLKCEMRIDLTGDQEMLFITRWLTLHVPYTQVNTVEYGQHVSRRYAAAILISPLMLLSKSRQHFVTLGYTDANGHEQALVFQVGKGDIRAMLAGLEAKTGRRVEYTDDDARKGKG